MKLQKSNPMQFDHKKTRERDFRQVNNFVVFAKDTKWITVIVEKVGVMSWIQALFLQIEELLCQAALMWNWSYLSSSCFINTR